MVSAVGWMLEAKIDRAYAGFGRQMAGWREGKDQF
jgi:hypothetical protein